jgi:hypothetical protein
MTAEEAARAAWSALTLGASTSAATTSAVLRSTTGSTGQAAPTTAVLGVNALALSSAAARDDNPVT